MPRNKMVLVLVGIVALVLLFFKPQSEEDDMKQYLVETVDFDFTPDLEAVADDIQERSLSTNDAIRRTLIFVYDNVDYDATTTINYCYNEKASDVLRSKKGDCVSMTKLTISLLRLQGIPTRSVGGCLSFGSCVPLMAVIPEAPVEVPKPDRQIDFKKRGFLHEWAEVWNGNQWLLLETTNGHAYDKNCQNYIFYSYDENQFDRCVINDQGFFNECVAS